MTRCGRPGGRRWRGLTLPAAGRGCAEQRRRLAACGAGRPGAAPRPAAPCKPSRRAAADAPRPLRAPQANNAVVREFGTPRREEGLRNHYDLVQMLDIVNLEAGTAVRKGGGGVLVGCRARWGGGSGTQGEGPGADAGRRRPGGRHGGEGGVVRRWGQALGKGLSGVAAAAAAAASRRRPGPRLQRREQRRAAAPLVTHAPPRPPTLPPPQGRRRPRLLPDARGPPPQPGAHHVRAAVCLPPRLLPRAHPLLHEQGGGRGLWGAGAGGGVAGKPAGAGVCLPAAPGPPGWQPVQGLQAPPPTPRLDANPPATPPTPTPPSRQDIMAECAQLSQFDEELYKVTGGWRLGGGGSGLGGRARGQAARRGWVARQHSGRACGRPAPSGSAPRADPRPIQPQTPPRRGRGQISDCDERADAVRAAPQGVVREGRPAAQVRADAGGGGCSSWGVWELGGASVGCSEPWAGLGLADCAPAAAWSAVPGLGAPFPPAPAPAPPSLPPTPPPPPTPPHPPKVRRLQHLLPQGGRLPRPRHAGHLPDPPVREGGGLRGVGGAGCPGVAGRERAGRVAA
jgi:hypothetical protein